LSFLLAQAAALGYIETQTAGKKLTQAVFVLYHAAAAVATRGLFGAVTGGVGLLALIGKGSAIPKAPVGAAPVA
jgi:hypothetical protein